MENLRAVLFCADDKILKGGIELLSRWKDLPDSTLWIDIQDDLDSEVRGFLLELECHPLAIQDAMRVRHPPKIEDFDDHTFMLYRGIAELNTELEYKPQQLAFFVKAGLLVTFHREESVSINKQMELERPIPVKNGAGYLALRIIRSSAGRFLENILEFEVLLSEIEDELGESGNEDTLLNLIAYRSRLLKLRRIFNYHENITRELLAYSYSNMSSEDSEFAHVINDVHDRLQRLSSLSQMFYDICGDLIDGYISISSHHLNIAMRVLTVITAIFVPLSFMAGVYGMNFEYMPELKSHYGYFTLIAIMLSTAFILLYVFKRKQWL